MFISDTHSWLWYLSSDSRLGENAKDVFRSTDDGDSTVIIPSIVVAESVYITKDRGYTLKMEKILTDLETSSNYILRSMDYRILSKLISDDRDLSIHDKIIVITAEIENAKILSRDEKIENQANVEVIW